MKRILAFSGSNSTQSINQQLIHIAAGLVDGAKVTVIDLRDYDAPLYGIDLEKTNGIPDPILKLKELMKEHDGYIVSTPEHNGSMSAFLKNTIDWLSRIDKKVFNDKPVLFLATSPGARGAKSALDHLVSIMPFRGANVVGGFSLGNFNNEVSDGVLKEESAAILKVKLTKLHEAMNV